LRPVEVHRIPKEMHIIGKTLRTSFEGRRHAFEIPPFFHSVMKSGELDALPRRRDETQFCVFRMRRASPDFDYIMGVEVEGAGEVPEGMEFVTLSPGEYAVTSTVKRGPDDVGSAFRHIYEEWLPASPYEAAGAPGFVRYDERFFSVFRERGYAGNPVVDVYVPITPKGE